MSKDLLQLPHFGPKCCLSAGILFLVPQFSQATIILFTTAPFQIFKKGKLLAKTLNFVRQILIQDVLWHS
jgi:hypothetical protein